MTKQTGKTLARPRRSVIRQERTGTAARDRKLLATTAPERNTPHAVASTAASLQWNRDIVKAWARDLDPIHKTLLQALLTSAAVDAIELWERERPERQRREFYKPSV